jgi:hypothetical protein
MDDNTPVTAPYPAGSLIQDKVTPPAVKAPARPKGPNASPIVVGLVAMLFAGLIIATETMHLRIDWSQVGPGAIVGIGVVMVVIGAIGLLRRHDKV